MVSYNNLYYENLYSGIVFKMYIFPNLSAPLIFFFYIKILAEYIIIFLSKSIIAKIRKTNLDSKIPYCIWGKKLDQVLFWIFPVGVWYYYL